MHVSHMKLLAEDMQASEESYAETSPAPENVLTPAGNVVSLRRGNEHNASTDVSETA